MKLLKKKKYMLSEQSKHPQITFKIKDYKQGKVRFKEKYSNVLVLEAIIYAFILIVFFL